MKYVYGVTFLAIFALVMFTWTEQMVFLLGLLGSWRVGIGIHWLSNAIVNKYHGGPNA